MGEGSFSLALLRIFASPVSTSSPRPHRHELRVTTADLKGAQSQGMIALGVHGAGGSLQGMSVTVGQVPLGGRERIVGRRSGRALQLEGDSASDSSGTSATPAVRIVTSHAGPAR